VSAIFGFCNFDGSRPDRAVLERQSCVLSHRGSDATGLWLDENAAMGQRMLWTTPESVHDRLPLIDRDSATVITADVRLDNREELLRLFQLDHVTGKQTGDAQLLHMAYMRWGEDCVQKLLGDFVFVIWDSRHRRFFCARDPFGIKHFYYHFSPQKRFVFASEAKAIFCVPGIERKLNELSIADHLLPYYEDRVTTPFKEIQRLPAAHSLTVSEKGIQFCKYWHPDLSRERRLNSSDEYAEEFREIFSEAVRCRLRTAYPVGTMLSGGLDSSSIACVASDELRAHNRGPLHTFTGVFPSLTKISPKIDERDYAQSIIERGGIQPHMISVDAFSPLVDLDLIHWHLDHSLPATNMYLDWAVFKKAQAEGVRVLFSGNDGDSVIGFGLDDFQEYARRGQWITMFREAASLARQAKRPYVVFKKLAWHEGLKTLAPEKLKQYWRRLHGRPATDSEPKMPDYCQGSLISPDLAKRLNITERVWELQNTSYPTGRTVREHHWSCISSGTDQFLLESFEKGAGAFSVEVRYPFFDKRVVEFCLSLPPGQRLKAGWTRSILRRSMEGILPPKVQWRVGKADMSANFKLKLLEYERKTLDHVVEQSDDLLSSYVSMDGLRSAYKKYLTDPMVYQTESFNIALVVNLAQWLQRAEAYANSIDRLTTSDIAPALSSM